VLADQTLRKKEMLHEKERQSLRTFGARWMEHANQPVMQDRKRQWQADAGVYQRPQAGLGFAEKRHAEHVRGGEEL